MTVIGIVLGSYLTLCSRAMNLSNRSYQAGVAQQLAEFGMEEGLRAFNKNDWSGWSSGGTSVVWDTTTYAASKRAIAGVAFPASKFGQGVTASVKIRVDNYDAAQLGSSYNSGKTYHLNAVVGHNGVWYRSVRNNNSGNTPVESGPFLWWVPAPIPWQWSKDNNYTDRSDVDYQLYDLTNNEGTWFRCIKDAPKGTPGSQPVLSQTWSSASVTYGYGDVVIYNSDGRAYRCINPHVSDSSASTNPSTPSSTYWSSSLYWLPLISSQPWISSNVYAEDDVVSYLGIQYRCLSDNTTSLPTDTSKWSQQVIPISLASSSWNSSTNYSRGSVVNYSGKWYYCRRGGTTIAPGTSTKWAQIIDSDGDALTPAFSEPLPDTRYSVGDYVYYSGNWYRCTANHVTPSSGAWDPSKWTLSYAPYISWAYRSSGASYSFNDTVYYSAGPAWYRCKTATTTGAPTTGNWEKALADGWGWDSTTRLYNLGDVVYYNSKWYRCTLTHTSTSALPLTPGTAAGATYWSNSPLFQTAWDSNRQYGVNDTALYGGVWYRCLVANNNSRPTPSNTNWASTSAAANQWNAVTNYTANTSFVSYGGVWYKCTANNSGQSPNNSSFWTSSWKNSWQPNSTDAMGAPVIYAEATVTISNSPLIRTQLRTVINPAALFPNALAASTTLQASAGGTIDSYDSFVDPSASTLGYSAIVAAGSTSGTAVSLSSTTVKGYLAAPSAATPPYAPAVSSGGSLKNSDGSVTSPAMGNMNLDLTRISRSPNIPQFDTVPRGAGGLSATWGTNPRSVSLPTSFSSITTIGTPGATTPSRYYYNDLKLGGSSSLTTLNIIGPVILYINGYLLLDGSPNGVINITSTGSAEIHLAGHLRVNAGSNGINNTTNDPKKLVIISDTTSASAQSYSAVTTPFYGLIYVPYTTSSDGLRFDGSSGITVYGAVSAKKITYSVDANVHYDTSLRYATIPGVDQPYAATDWRILPAAEQATMP